MGGEAEVGAEAEEEEEGIRMEEEGILGEANMAGSTKGIKGRPPLSLQTRSIRRIYDWV